MTNADYCRQRGWNAGTVVIGEDASGTVRLQITAVGEREILVKHLAARHRGRDWDKGGRSEEYMLLVRMDGETVKVTREEPCPSR